MAQKKAARLPPLVTSLLPAQFDDVVEIDELWSFVGSKAQRVWLWTAVCRRTRQIVSFALGERDARALRALIDTMSTAYANCRSRSDEYHVYKRLTLGHRRCPKKSGETAHAEAVNTVLRQRVARLVRRTCSFSKTREHHEIALRLFIQEYNETIKSVKM